MKKLFLLTALFVLGGSVNAMAMNCPTMVAKDTPYACITSVYNDSGSDLTSGTVVIWDNDDTEFDESGYPYVTTTTNTDSDWVAGVMQTGDCKAGTMCDIVVRGFAWTLIADSTDAVAEDTLVSTSAVAGMAGDYGAGANSCALGQLISTTQKSGGADSNADGQVFPVWVNVNCQ